MNRLKAGANIALDREQPFDKMGHSSIPDGIFNPTVTCGQISVARLRVFAMPILFWLPIIFASALLEIAASPSMPERSQNIRISKKRDEMTKLTDGTHSYGPDDYVNLKAQIADQKQVINSLRAQLADIHEQMNRWQSRADRISLTASY